MPACSTDSMFNKSRGGPRRRDLLLLLLLQSPLLVPGDLVVKLAEDEGGEAEIGNLGEQSGRIGT